MPDSASEAYLDIDVGQVLGTTNAIRMTRKSIGVIRNRSFEKPNPMATATIIANNAIENVVGKHTRHDLDQVDRF